MIRFRCPSCRKQLNAKDELAGQTRKCPGCGTPVQVPQSSEETQPTAVAPDVEVHAHVEVARDQKGLAKFEHPERLDRHNQYLICDKSKLVATWENNGHSWLLNLGFGFGAASRNQEQIPGQGDFKLVELTIEMTEDGRRLKGVQTYQLAKRWALGALERGDDDILKKITGPGFLNREQKNIVRKRIRKQLLPQVWEDASEVFEFLTNQDYHSPGAVCSS